MSTRTLRVGTRASLLARTQTGLVVDGAGRAGRDRAGRRPPAIARRPRSRQLGGTGVFVSALRDALLAGEIDVAVHSYKDLPTAPAPTASSSPPCRVREDPRDALVAAGGRVLGELLPGARVGTGSPRRAAQLRALGPGP